MRHETIEYYKLEWISEVSITFRTQGKRAGIRRTYSGCTIYGFWGFGILKKNYDFV